uniref:Protein ORF4 n=1 Tax=Anguillid herpesvirus 1 TaxID=150286 RepID=A0A8E5AKM8_9VIRU|nr:protein ORF4 [Anguillid herpesvirus 1]QRM16818.1 protein ORF4 [Anguillid herpesvirus 1]
MNAKELPKKATQKTKKTEKRKRVEKTTNELEVKAALFDKILEVLNCSVCLSDFGGKPKCLPCGHSFCTACIRQLNKRDKICPTCRRIYFTSGPCVNFALNSVLEICKPMRPESPPPSPRIVRKSPAAPVSSTSATSTTTTTTTQPTDSGPRPLANGPNGEPALVGYETDPEQLEAIIRQIQRDEELEQRNLLQQLQQSTVWSNTDASSLSSIHSSSFEDASEWDEMEERRPARRRRMNTDRQQQRGTTARITVTHTLF